METRNSPSSKGRRRQKPSWFEACSSVVDSAAKREKQLLKRKQPEVSLRPAGKGQRASPATKHSKRLRRREVHKKSGTSNNECKVAPTRVVVIGAGISGLTVARELQCRGGQPIDAVFLFVVVVVCHAHSLTRLHFAGYDIVVLEAKNRVGGRISSLSTANLSSEHNQQELEHVELGAMFIHRAEGNPVAELASELGLELVPYEGCG